MVTGRDIFISSVQQGDMAISFERARFGFKIDRATPILTKGPSYSDTGLLFVSIWSSLCLL